MLTGAINVYSRLKTDNTIPYDFPASDNRYYEISPFPPAYSHLNPCSEVDFIFPLSQHFSVLSYSSGCSIQEDLFQYKYYYYMQLRMSRKLSVSW